MSDEPNIVIMPQRWTATVRQSVDGAAWRCFECGWLGEHLYSVAAAQREAGRHFKENHPDFDSVRVELRDET